MQDGKVGEKESNKRSNEEGEFEEKPNKKQKKVPKRKVVLIMSYLGEGYHGFQFQK